MLSSPVSTSKSSLASSDARVNNRIHASMIDVDYNILLVDHQNSLEGYTHDLCWPVAIEDPSYSMIIHCDHKIVIQSHVWNG